MTDPAELGRPPSAADLPGEPERWTDPALILPSLIAGVVWGVVVAGVAVATAGATAASFAGALAVVGLIALVVLVPGWSDRLDPRIVLSVGAVVLVVGAASPLTSADRWGGRAAMVVAAGLILLVDIALWVLVGRAATEIRAWNVAYERLVSEPLQARDPRVAAVLRPAGRGVQRLEGTVEFDGPDGGRRSVPLATGRAFARVVPSERRLPDDPRCAVWYDREFSIVLTRVLGE